MKRKATIAALMLVLLMAFTQFAYADSLSIVKTVPNDGETGKQPANFAVKIVFSEDMSLEANDKLNESCVKIVDESGKSQKFQLVHHDKYPNELWFVLESDLVTDTEYKVVVSSGVKATSGNTLSGSSSFTFRTRDTKKDNTISITLTFAMMAIMMLFSSRSMKQKTDDKDTKKQSPSKVAQADPYRLAKEQNISVSEAKAMIAKEQSKLDKKNASSEKARKKKEAEEAAKEAEIQKRLKAIHDASVYKVIGPNSIQSHGKSLPKSLVKKLAARKKTKKK